MCKMSGRWLTFATRLQGMFSENISSVFEGGQKGKSKVKDCKERELETSQDHSPI